MHFFRFYPAKWTDRTLSEKVILCIIESFPCTAKNKYFAEATGLEIRQIEKYLKRLKDDGIIDIKYSGNVKSPKSVRTITIIVNIVEKDGVT